jgi:hypothetical protein
MVTPRNDLVNIVTRYVVSNMSQEELLEFVFEEIQVFHSECSDEELLEIAERAGYTAQELGFHDKDCPGVDGFGCRCGA